MAENIASSTTGVKTMQLNDQKAGMQGLDKEMINNIIFESSKGTPYFAFQEKRQKSIDSKVAELNSNMKKYTEQERKESLEKMTKLASLLEFERDLTHSIVHIDMDAFYAAVEMEDNPKLRNIPMAVGSSSMLSTSNYLARKFGVRAAMPGFIAKKLCPNLTIVPCNFEKYRKVSNVVKAIIKEYDPDYSSAGLDEVYLDLTGYINNEYKKQLHCNYCIPNSQNEPILEDDDQTYRDCLSCSQSISFEERDQLAYDIVNEIRKKIHEATNLTASAGIAPNTMLAKVCSDQNKPNGQYQIPSTLDAVHSFISTLPVKKISGIGPVQGQILNAVGIYTCADMWDKRDIVGLLFSPTSVDFYMRVSIGLGNTTVKSEYVRKSIGTEHTFKEMNQRDQQLEKCQELSEEVVEDLIRRNMLGKVVVLKYKTTDFHSHTRNHSLSFYTADKDIIVKTAKKLLDTEIAAVAPKPLCLRLMGIRMANLVFEGELPNIEKHVIKIKDYLKCHAPSTSSVSPEKTCTEVISDSNKDVQPHLTSSNGISNFDKREKQSEVNQTLDHNSNSSRAASNNVFNITCSTSSGYTCPVCNLIQNVENLTELNSHIDNCLNKVTIKEILAEEQSVEGKRKIHENERHKKKLKTTDKSSRRIEEFFH